jgi:hypothetical protein
LGWVVVQLERTRDGIGKASYDGGSRHVTVYSKIAGDRIARAADQAFMQMQTPRLYRVILPVTDIERAAAFFGTSSRSCSLVAIC